MCELNIELISIASFWSQKVATEVKYQKDKLCRHKYKLLETEATFWSYWYLDHITNVIKSEKYLCDIESAEQMIDKMTEEYKSKIKSIDIFKPLVNIYCNIHVILIEEFKSEILDLIKSYQSGEEQIYIYKLGELLHQAIVATILELKELTLDCGLLAQTKEDRELFIDARTDPLCTQSVVNPYNLTVFVTNAYDINSYAVKKIHKMIEVFQKEQNAKDVKITFNFQFYKARKEFFDKIYQMILVAQRYFKEIELKNIDKELLNYIQYKMNEIE